MKIDEIRLPGRPAVTSTPTQYQGSKRNAMVKPTQKATDTEVNEPYKIAGNRKQQDNPGTYSKSTIKSVPSMPKSAIKKNVVVTDPETGEEIGVENDVVANQMMRRAKRFNKTA
tara:strand:+ start:5 stop:346 length:342 start_codon:yes stop_codon:yes gene_type:complete